MPFTLAHPAAAVPLRRVLGRTGILSALVIGSMTPDFAYFLPIGITRGQSHTPAALLWFCLPIGLVTYVAFHGLVKRPLIALLPVRLSTHLAALVAPPAVPGPALAVATSLVVGALTHIVWDSFTHGGAPAIHVLPRLRTAVVPIGVWDVQLFKLLQHASTALGLALLWHWSWRWYATAPVRPHAATPTLSPRARALGALAIVAATILFSATAVVAALRGPAGADAIRRVVHRAVVSGMMGLGLGLLGFSVAWHVWARLRRDAGGAP